MIFANLEVAGIKIFCLFDFGLYLFGFAAGEKFVVVFAYNYKFIHFFDVPVWSVGSSGVKLFVD